MKIKIVYLYNIINNLLIQLVAYNNLIIFAI